MSPHLNLTDWSVILGLTDISCKGQKKGFNGSPYFRVTGPEAAALQADTGVAQTPDRRPNH
jgi:hypothetical protein